MCLLKCWYTCEWNYPQYWSPLCHTEPASPPQSVSCRAALVLTSLSVLRGWHFIKRPCDRAGVTRTILPPPPLPLRPALDVPFVWCLMTAVMEPSCSVITPARCPASSLLLPLPPPLCSLSVSIHPQQQTQTLCGSNTALSPFVWATSNLISSLFFKICIYVHTFMYLLPYAADGEAQWLKISFSPAQESSGGFIGNLCSWVRFLLFAWTHTLIRRRWAALPIKM